MRKRPVSIKTREKKNKAREATRRWRLKKKKKQEIARRVMIILNNSNRIN